MSKARQPGTVAANKIPIYARGADNELQQRGHVGAKATSVTVSRFIGKHGAKLGKVKGRTAWIGPATPSPTPLQRKAETANQKSARGSNPAPRTSYSFPK